MVSQEILDAIHHYIEKVRQAGIEVVTAVLFGSFSQGTAATDSDIDLIVVSPEFDQRNEARVNLLWELRALADPRIEPIACGSRQWLEDDSSPILTIARENGVVISLEDMVAAVSGGAAVNPRPTITHPQWGAVEAKKRKYAG